MSHYQAMANITTPSHGLLVVPWAKGYGIIISMSLHQSSQIEQDIRKIWGYCMYNFRTLILTVLLNRKY